MNHVPSESPDPLLLATAVEAVQKAGAIQMAHFGGPMRIDKKGAIDLVTEVDVAVERMFRALIAERFPDHLVLGEELQEDDLRTRQAPGYCWVFDPIDGTTNFAHGLPIFCASLGLELDGEAIVAAVYDPTRRELFTAEKGHGARLNGERLAVSRSSAVLESLLVTGFPYNVQQPEVGEELVDLFGHFLGRSRAVRRLGSAALDLCYVAAGRLDGFYEAALKPWDSCGGALIVEEAGGRVSDWRGTRFQSRMPQVLATNGAIHDEMLALLTEFHARRSGLTD
ncbi:inositol monophosphatase family protein [Luteitalea sp.]|jgi:myo-inositol-1(or 4)-monophosphatase|uniref:inositol monophosphatase family protein n=1 Tax=Luteitalea sp. TaxID=2004800 RepID=UPI0037C895BC